MKDEAHSNAYPSADQFDSIVCCRSLSSSYCVWFAFMITTMAKNTKQPNYCRFRHRIQFAKIFRHDVVRQYVTPDSTDTNAPTRKCQAILCELVNRQQILDIVTAWWFAILTFARILLSHVFTTVLLFLVCESSSFVCVCVCLFMNLVISVCFVIVVSMQYLRVRYVSECERWTWKRSRKSLENGCLLLWSVDTPFNVMPNKDRESAGDGVSWRYSADAYLRTNICRLTTESGIFAICKKRTNAMDDGEWECHVSLLRTKNDENALSISDERETSRSHAAHYRYRLLWIVRWRHIPIRFAILLCLIIITAYSHMTV